MQVEASLVSKTTKPAQSRIDASVDGTGTWRKGVSRRTLDPKIVTRRDHATASLYQYTPWVLTGRGGNWLVWNVTRKYVRHAEAQGFLDEEPEAPVGPGEPGELGASED